MIDLYTGPTGNGRRAALALAESGLAHTVHRLNLQKGDHKQPEFLKINPSGAIPAIVDTDGPGGKPLMLAQSGAIVRYCAEKSGRLIPGDPQRRIEAFEWFMQAVTDVAPASAAIFYLSQAPEKSAANTAFLEQRFMTYCANADRHLEGREYLAGEFSIADIALYPVAHSRKAMIDAAPGLTNWKAWERRAAARPQVIAGLEANG